MGYDYTHGLGMIGSVVENVAHMPLSLNPYGGNVGVGLGGVVLPNYAFQVNGTTYSSTFASSYGIHIDLADTNSGWVSPGIVFGGENSGEAIASKRTAGGNQWGLDFYTSFTRKMALSNSGNLVIGSDNIGSGGHAAIIMAGGSRPSSFDGIALYASGSALRVSDQYGNEGWVGPNFSPSSLEAPEVLYDAEESLPAIETEVQYYAGFVRYTNKTRQAKLAGMTDAEKQQLSPARRTCVIKETFAEHEARPGERLTQLIWEEEQAKIKQMKDAERQALIEEKARLTAAAEAKDKEIAAAKDKNKASIQKESAKLREKLKSIKISEEYVMQPIPPRLQAALGK